MGDVRGNGERVPFDFEGSLTLARRLWALASTIEQSASSRATKVEVAQAKWEGPYRTDFDGRATDEATSSSRVVAALREEARGWADAWREAMEEQNRRNRAAKVTEVRDDRGWMERNVGDRIMGDDSDEEVPQCPTIATPQPPSFLATADESLF